MNLSDILKSILEMTAWRMDPPELFGGFHVLATGITLLAATLLAALVTAPMRQSLPEGRHYGTSSSGPERHVSRDPRESKLIRILAVCGWILIIMELFKQLFLYYIVNGGAYDWWYFPFQLCSVPMYLCILLPAVRGRLRDAFLTFMAGYTFISAFAALAYPQDFLRSYTVLTAHGFLWHGILLFISLAIALSGLSDLSIRGFARATLLFLVLCVTAAGINTAIEVLILGNGSGLAGRVYSSYPAMFYLNPLRISPQPLVGTVQQAIGPPAGIAAGLVLYVCTIIAAAGMYTAIMCHRLDS
ncbi:MAG: YwaF family protein [Mogibacterium sp.]|nr:YwaF family protein [Mogibacterium sp.]